MDGVHRGKDAFLFAVLRGLAASDPLLCPRAAFCQTTNGSPARAAYSSWSWPFTVELPEDYTTI